MSVETKLVELTEAVSKLTNVISELVELQKDIRDKGRQVKRELSQQQRALTKPAVAKPVVNKKVERTREQIDPKVLDNKIISNMKEIAAALEMEKGKSEAGLFCQSVLEYAISISDYESPNEVSLVGPKSKLNNSQKLNIIKFIEDSKEAMISEPELL